MTIIAVNLPSLWYFLAGVSPERVLRSVRSMVSIISGHSSQGSVKQDDASDNQWTRHKERRGSSASSTVYDGDRNAHLAFGEKGSNKTFSRTDICGQGAQNKLSDAQGIQVKQSMHQVEQRV